MQQLLTDIKALATYIPSGLNTEITGKNAQVSVFLKRGIFAKADADIQDSNLAYICGST